MQLTARLGRELTIDDDVVRIERETSADLLCRYSRDMPAVRGKARGQPGIPDPDVQKIALQERGFL